MRVGQGHAGHALGHGDCLCPAGYVPRRMYAVPLRERQSGRRSMIHTITLPTPFDVGPINVYLLEGSAADPGGHRRQDQPDHGRAAPGPGRPRLPGGRHPADHHHPRPRRPFWPGRPDRGRIRRAGAHPPAQLLLADRLPERVGAALRLLPRRLPAERPHQELAQQVRDASAAMVRFADSVPVARLLDEGDVLDLDGQPWQVLFTPGHAGGLICLHQAEKPRAPFQRPPAEAHHLQPAAGAPRARRDRRAAAAWWSIWPRCAASPRWTWRWPCRPTASPSTTPAP